VPDPGLPQPRDCPEGLLWRQLQTNGHVDIILSHGGTVPSRTPIVLARSNPCVYLEEMFGALWDCRPVLLSV
jgi:hypothetical protein